MLACASLHRGLTKTDLAFFAEHGHVLVAWLAELPQDVDLGSACDEVIDHIATLSGLKPEVGLSLLSKVAHRKRPQLVPLFDSTIADWYRPQIRRAWSCWLAKLGPRRSAKTSISLTTCIG